MSSGVGGADVEAVQGALVGVEMRSTTIGRIGTSFSVAIAVRARLFTVCSNGVNPRTDTVSASAPIRSRRREVTVVPPLLVGKTAGAVSFIERVQTSVEAVAELERLPTHHFGHRRVFTLGVAK